MKNFILVKDAATDKLMIIRKSMICRVEESIQNAKPVRAIYYTDCRRETYVKESLLDILKYLEEEE